MRRSLGEGGIAPRSTANVSAFTLLEILLVIALIGLIATSLIGISSHLMSGRPLTADELFWKATQAARKSAVLKNHDVLLSFDPKGKAFVLDDGTSVKAMAVPSATDDLNVDFLASQGSASAMLGGTAVETQTVPFVTFFADGTCVPFRVQFRNKGGAHTKEIDPWTCAQILTPPNPNGLGGPP